MVVIIVFNICVLTCPACHHANHFLGSEVCFCCCCYQCWYCCKMYVHFHEHIVVSVLAMSLLIFCFLCSVIVLGF